ncbi:unnamed protein product [Vicia faba]|uniref:EF-hand domain-containing protein n=1 Tax=Vicia faba TaxID=3906 RepID=A0AAV1B9P8_VICFA|nr:unnamed protein product [Vicia faba]
MFRSSLFPRVLICDVRMKCSLSILWKYVSHYIKCRIISLASYYYSNAEEHAVKQGLNNNIQSGVRLCKEEIIDVMEKLGLREEFDGVSIVEFGDEQEISNMFENGVSLEEVEEAFNVFDKNKDGFIEAVELQRVLCCLGFERDFEECQKMINAVDENGDELIDHFEFVKLVEQSFS